MSSSSWDHTLISQPSPTDFTSSCLDIGHLTWLTLSPASQPCFWPGPPLPIHSFISRVMPGRLLCARPAPGTRETAANKTKPLPTPTRVYNPMETQRASKAEEDKTFPRSGAVTRWPRKALTRGDVWERPERREDWAMEVWGKQCGCSPRWQPSNALVLRLLNFLKNY